MILPDALHEVFDNGQRIARRVWANSRIYIELHQSQLCIKGFPDDGLWHPWTITESDWFADDWEVIND